MTELLNLIHTIASCRSLDDLQSLLVHLDGLGLKSGDQRVLRPHLQAKARQLLRDERLEKAAGVGR